MSLASLLKYINLAFQNKILIKFSINNKEAIFYFKKTFKMIRCFNNKKILRNEYT